MNKPISVKAQDHAADMMSMQERRSEVRMMCADMIDVLWYDEFGKRRRTIGLLEDISHSGACLQLEKPIPPGTEIHWQCPKRPFVARVRYCVFREIGYFVGVEFEPNSKWTKKLYVPQHLLDLERLMERAKK